VLLLYTASLPYILFDPILKTLSDFCKLTLCFLSFLLYLFICQCPRHPERTAYLSYHTSSLLSTTFCPLFIIFFILFLLFFLPRPFTPKKFINKRYKNSIFGIVFLSNKIL